jgi:hypothetical protein
MVNTVAKFEGIDDHRFICSRCAPSNFARDGAGRV